MVNKLTFLHIENSAWIGIYLNGRKIADGYFNSSEIAAAEEAFIQYGGLVGLIIVRLNRTADWFNELGGVLPHVIGDVGEVMSKPDSSIPMRNYYRNI